MPVFLRTCKRYDILPPFRTVRQIGVKFEKKRKGSGRIFILFITGIGTTLLLVAEPGRRSGLADMKLFS